MGLFSGLFGGGGGHSASHDQKEAVEEQIAYEKQIRDQMMHQLAPYAGVGPDALKRLQALSTPEGQQEFFDNYSKSGEFKTLSAQARNQQLAADEATGTLGGSSTQNALASIAPQLEERALGRQLGLDNTLTGIGLQGVTGANNALESTGQQIVGSLGDLGAARAGEDQARSGFLGQLGGLAGGIGALATGNQEFAGPASVLGQFAGSALGRLF